MLAALVLLASSCGDDDGVMVQSSNGTKGVLGPTDTFSHSGSSDRKISAMPYRARLGQLISARFTADNSNSAALSTLLSVELTKHVDLSA